MQWFYPLDIPPAYHHILNMSTCHFGYVTKIEGDPLKKGRCRLCIPSVFGEGEENWTNYVEILGTPTGSTKNKGDVGFHIPPAVGQQVMVFFKNGDPLQPVAIPAGYWSEEAKAGEQMMPKEVKNAADDDKQHLVTTLKTPAGHNLYFGDETGKELARFQHAAGFGLNLMGGIKGSEPSQSEKDATNYRTANKRGDECVGCETAKKPGEIFKDGNSIIQLAGQNGSGLSIVDDGQGGTLLLSTHQTNGSEQGPSIYMSTKEGGLILLTVGNVQLQIRGAKGDIKVTKQVIQEAVKEEVEEKFTKKLKNYIKEFMRKATYYKGGSGSGSSNNSGSGSSTSTTGESSSSGGSLGPSSGFYSGV